MANIAKALAEQGIIVEPIEHIEDE